MAPQIAPGSSKIVSERLTIIGGINFWDSWASKVSPWVPKVFPGVPKWTPRAHPRLQKGTLWEPKVSPGKRS